MKKIYQQLIYLTFLMLIYFSIGSCTIHKTTIIEAKKVDFNEGWAGSPSNLNQEPHNYFYVKSLGKASSKAIMKKSGAMMETTCIPDATVNKKEQILQSIIDSSISPNNASENNKKANSILKDLDSLVQNSGVKDCRGIAVPEHQIPFSEFKECECVLYVEVSGGTNSIQSLIKKL